MAESVEKRRKRQREWARKARAEKRVRRNYRREYDLRASKPRYRERIAAKQRRRYRRPDVRFKALARAKTQDFIRRGIIKRQPCEKCGAPAQSHHDDYSKPLQVRWLCRQHHRAEHARIDGAA